MYKCLLLLRIIIFSSIHYIYEKYYILLRNYVLLYINYLHASWFLKKMCTAPENQIIEWCIEWMSFTNFVVSLFFISSSSPNVIYLCANIFLSVYEENIWINSESAKSKKNSRSGFHLIYCYIELYSSEKRINIC